LPLRNIFPKKGQCSEDSAFANCHTRKHDTSGTDNRVPLDRDRRLHGRPDRRRNRRAGYGIACHIIAHGKNARPMRYPAKISNLDAASADQAAMAGHVNMAAKFDSARRRHNTKWIDSRVISDGEAFRADNDNGRVNEDIIAAALNAERLERPARLKIAVVSAHLILHKAGHSVCQQESLRLKLANDFLK
jgi:hypothetical protein